MEYLNSVPWWLILAAVAFFFFRRGGGILYVKGPALVLRRIDFRPQESFIELEGRPGGFIAWLLSILRISPITRLTITPQVVRFEQGSLWGNLVEYTPLREIAVVSTGVTNRFGYVIAAVVFILGGLATSISSNSFRPTAAGVIAGGVMLVLWFLSRCLTIVIMSTGNTTSGVRVKRSVIEGVALDPEQAAEIVKTISEWVTYAQQITYTYLAETSVLNR